MLQTHEADPRTFSSDHFLRAATAAIAAAAAAAPQVSTRDHLIPPAMQFELADKLHAKTVTFPAGGALCALRCCPVCTFFVSSLTGAGCVRRMLSSATWHRTCCL
jgi:hypothetical protein